MRKFPLPAPAIPSGTVEVWEVPGPDGFCAFEFHWQDPRWGAVFRGRFNHHATANAFWVYRFLHGDVEKATDVEDAGFGAMSADTAKRIRRWLAAHPDWTRTYLPGSTTAIAIADAWTRHLTSQQ